MTKEEEIEQAIATQVALTALFYAFIHGTNISSIVTDNGNVPSVAKLVADIQAQIVGGYNAGYVVNVANTAGRTAAVPGLVGQFLFQRDTMAIYYANGLAAGNWASHPINAAIAQTTTNTNDIAAANIVIGGKMSKTTYDPSNLGFSIGNSVINVYLASGVYTVPPGSDHMIEILCVGGGGGGGSGRRGAAASARAGGCGGSAGGMTRNFMQRSMIAETVWNVTVGTGGAGGAAITVDSTSGNPGAGGTGTQVVGASLGTMYARAVQGNGGYAGGTVALAGPNGTDNSCGTQFDSGNPSLPGGSSVITGASPVAPTGATTYLAPTGGGAGGHITTANLAGTGAGGGPIGNANIGQNFGGGPGGLANQIAPFSNGTVGYSSGYMVGSGGGGGGAGSTVAAGAGGPGGNYGAGGGGGGASVNGFASGAGGAGAPGICIIITTRVQ